MGLLDERQVAITGLSIGDTIPAGGMIGDAMPLCFDPRADWATLQTIRVNGNTDSNPRLLLHLYEDLALQTKIGVLPFPFPLGLDTIGVNATHLDARYPLASQGMPVMAAVPEGAMFALLETLDPFTVRGGSLGYGGHGFGFSYRLAGHAAPSPEGLAEVEAARQVRAESERVRVAKAAHG